MESERLLLDLLEVRPQAVVRFTTPDWTVDRIQRLASEQIRSEHIVLALINDEGTAGEVLGEIGLTREKLLAFIREQTSC